MRTFAQRAALWIDINFGTYRGLVRLILGELEYLFGRLSLYTEPRTGDIQRLVFVCLGNINRSAFAAEVARVNGAHVISIGLSTTSGMPAFKNAISTAKLFGFDLGAHKALDFSDYTYLPGDLLLAMEVRHTRYLIRRGIPPRAIALLGHWGTPRRIHIHDPHVLSDLYFQTCFLILYSATKRLVRELNAGKAGCFKS